MSRNSVPPEQLALQRLYHWEKTTPNRTVFTQPMGGGQVQTFTWAQWRDRIPNALALLKTQATDPHPGVRLEAVRAASFFQSTEAAEVALASLEQPQDRFLKYTLDQTMNTLKAFIK